jgi:3-(methylthio)propionyl---CoA ligase
MLGLMQDDPLLISDLIEHAERHHGDVEIVSRRTEGDIHRTTYGQAAARSRQLAGALDAMGLAHSDRVASLAWNGYRHFEMYFGVSGSGRVLHTINPRLHSRADCLDREPRPGPGAVLRHHVLAHGEGGGGQVPHRESLGGPVRRRHAGQAHAGRHRWTTCTATKPWIASQPTTYAWPRFDDNDASSMCYTSGTTGNPKAVLYSHKSTILHAYAAALPDCDVHLERARLRCLPVVPMFHVNAWGIPYCAAMRRGLQIGLSWAGTRWQIGLRTDRQPRG